MLARLGALQPATQPDRLQIMPPVVHAGALGWSNASVMPSMLMQLGGDSMGGAVRQTTILTQMPTYAAHMAAAYPGMGAGPPSVFKSIRENVT